MFFATFFKRCSRIADVRLLLKERPTYRLPLSVANTWLFVSLCVEFVQQVIMPGNTGGVVYPEIPSFRDVGCRTFYASVQNLRIGHRLTHVFVLHALRQIGL